LPDALVKEIANVLVKIGGTVEIVYVSVFDGFAVGVKRAIAVPTVPVGITKLAMGVASVSVTVA
jgi:hypothetical protein